MMMIAQKSSGSRLLTVCGALCMSMGVTCLVPAYFEWSGGVNLAGTGKTVVWLGATLILGGAVSVILGLRKGRGDVRIPGPVRSAIFVNILFLGFCAMEFSDGLLRQGGRVFYWTSVLFLPALMLLFGLVSARRWAWWSARCLAVVFALWCLGFAFLIPFTDLRAQGESVPPWGRVYMICVTLLMGGASVYAFRELGNARALEYFKTEKGTKWLG